MSIPHELEGNVIYAGNVLRCVICGQPVAQLHKKAERYLTADHVVPKRLGVDIGFKQALCFRCNSLKSDLIPTAACYTLLQTVRDIEVTYPELYCNSIRIIYHQGVKAKYYVSFKQEKIWFTWELPSGEVVFGHRGDIEGVWSTIGKRALQDLVLRHLTE